MKALDMSRNPSGMITQCFRESLRDQPLQSTAGITRFPSDGMPFLRHDPVTRARQINNKVALLSQYR